MRLILLLRARWHRLKLWQAQIEHDSAIGIVHEADRELSRALAVFKETQGRLADAEAAAMRSGYRLMRHERLKRIAPWLI